MLVNSAFYTRKDFSENYPQMGNTPSQKKSIASRVLGRKRWKNIGFNGRQTTKRPGVLNY